MDKIEIQNVCPNVFADFKELRSDVWKNDICFERGKAYLIEAASGTGKSTLCSYLLGFRHDYTGTITFDSHNIRSLGKKDWVNLRKNEMAMLFQELNDVRDIGTLVSDPFHIGDHLKGGGDLSQIPCHRLLLQDQLQAEAFDLPFLCIDGGLQIVDLPDDLLAPLQGLIHLADGGLTKVSHLRQALIQLTELFFILISHI